MGDIKPPLLAAPATAAGRGSRGAPLPSTSFNPFSFKRTSSRVEVITSVDRVLEHITQHRGACCVLASAASLSYGPALALFQNFASQPRHAIIFTSRWDCAAGSLAAQLCPPLTGPAGGSAAATSASSASASVSSAPLRPPTNVFVPISTLVQLTGAELTAWKEAREEERRRAARAAALVRSRAAEDAETEAAMGEASALAAAAAGGGGLGGMRSRRRRA